MSEKELDLIRRGIRNCSHFSKSKSAFYARKRNVVHHHRKLFHLHRKKRILKHCVLLLREEAF